VFSTEQGETVTLASPNSIVTSHFDLSHSAISEPKIIHPESGPQLTTSVNFDFVFSTCLPAVQLGLLSLVETECFALLGNGECYSLRNSGEGCRVLYLADGGESDRIFTPLLEANQDAGSRQHNHRLSLIQDIPEQLEGSEVVTLTVLEHYTSYFMQRELPFNQKNYLDPGMPTGCLGLEYACRQTQ